MEVSDLPHNMNRQDERQQSEKEVSDAIANEIGNNVAEKTEKCQTDDDCDYPLKSCYDVEEDLTGDLGKFISVKACFVTWWFILILVLIGLVVFICIIACIVVCFCRVCC